MASSGSTNMRRAASAVSAQTFSLWRDFTCVGVATMGSGAWTTEMTSSSPQEGRDGGVSDMRRATSAASVQTCKRKGKATAATGDRGGGGGNDSRSRSGRVDGSSSGDGSRPA